MWKSQMRESQQRMFYINWKLSHSFTCEKRPQAAGGEVPQASALVGGDCGSPGAAGGDDSAGDPTGVAAQRREQAAADLNDPRQKNKIKAIAEKSSIEVQDKMKTVETRIRKYHNSHIRVAK
jgi:hypothetical protein